MKRSAILSLVILGLVGVLATVPASADDTLFNNIVTGTSYTSDAYGISTYEQNTNSFTLSSSSTTTLGDLINWRKSER